MDLQKEVKRANLLLAEQTTRSNYLIKMARPIEPTPVLEGKDAEKLIKEVNSASYNKDKQNFLDECRDTYKKIKR